MVCLWAGASSPSGRRIEEGVRPFGQRSWIGGGVGGFVAAREAMDLIDFRLDAIRQIERVDLVAQCDELRETG